MKQFENSCLRHVSRLCCALLGLALYSCGGSAPQLGTDPGFSLRVVNRLEDPAASPAQFSLHEASSADGLTLQLELAEATQLRAFGVELSYDPQRWHPLEAEGSGLLGGDGELLEAALDVRPGLYAYGQVQLPGSSAQPLSGGGSLASFRFAPGPAPLQRDLSATAAQAPELSWDEGSFELSWPYGNTGDYDQNSEVNIADLTPIGIHFGEASTDPLAATAMIDGDGNGEINIADITPIGINYGNALSGYRLWELSSPLDWQGPQDTPSLADIQFADAQGSPSQDRLSFSYNYAADPGYRYLRLATLNGTETGTPSEFIFTHPSLQPLLSITDDSGLSGSGTPEAPWNVQPLDSYTLQLMLQDSTDVSDDALSTYVLSGDGGATLTGRVLDFSADAAGEYHVTASYDGVPSAPFSLHFQLNIAPTAELTADPAAGRVPFTVLLDGTASSDPDGTIVLAEWDFDNDGIFDADSGAALTIEHEYAAEGSYEAVLRVTDDDGAVALSAPLAISVLPPNQAPQADLLVTPQSGDTPLNTLFDAGGSTDSDGSIVLYEWDFDGDGTYDASGSEDNLAHSYTVPGDYSPRVRVTDNEDAQSVSSALSIHVTGNFPPVVKLTAVPHSGALPLQVLLDATESTDPDGSIVQAEWDFGGDGDYDQSTTELSILHLYNAEGEFNARVRLTDDSGGVSESLPVLITAGAESGSAPTAQLLATPQSGPAPLLVQLDASGSTDPDDDIVLAEFDFDNDGSFDEQDTEDFITVHEYTDGGSYQALVRITDAQGHRSSSLPLAITVSSGSAPIASYTALSFSGTAPFDVVADASASMDPDGPLALYEWDADDDGIYEYGSSAPTAQFSLLGSGSHNIRLRVRDTDDNTSVATHVFSVQASALGWEDYSTGITNPQRAFYAVVAGRPAVAWQASPADVYFKRSADSAGHAWPVSGSLVDSGLADYPGGNMRLIGFMVSGGVPLMASLKGTASQEDYDLFVLRGLNAEGGSFALPLKLLGSFVPRVDRDAQGWPLLADFSGLPAICYGSDQSGAWQHLRALDSQGSSWDDTPDAINGSIAANAPLGSLLQDPAGGAQLFYFSSTAIRTNRDPDGNGSGWNFRQELLNVDNTLRLQALSNSGSVVLVYTVQTATGQAVYSTHAESPSFASWSDPFLALNVSGGSADMQLLVDNGKPELLLSGSVNGNPGIYFLRSHDALAGHWSEPQRISTQSGGELRGMAIANGKLTALHLRSNGSLRLLSRE